MINLKLEEGATADVTMCAIMPNYNGAHFIQRSLQSLLNQTVVFDEIIIIDDGSTDNSVTLIEEFLTEYPNIILLKHEKNLGVNIAINTGINYARSDYILFSATDDWFEPTIVAKAKKIASFFPNVGVICGDGIIKRFDLSNPFYRMLPYPANVFISAEEFKAISLKSYVGFNSAGGMFMQRQAIIAANRVYPQARWHADWLLYFIVALRQGIYYLNEVFIHVDMRKTSYSEGKNNKSIQNQVMLDIFAIVANDFPDLWNDFKKAALVPHHALRYIFLFCLNPITRKFITKRFIWKMLINNSVIVRLGRLFPYRIILKTRKFLRS